MSDIGQKMFMGAGIGAGVGALGGGIYGGLHARAEIEKLPTNTVNVPAHDVPIYDTRVVGHDNYTNIDVHDPGYSGSNTYEVTAKYPMRNADGSVQMQHIPATTETGHGHPVLNMQNNPIQEPSSIDHNTNANGNLRDGVSVNSTTSVTYKTIGYYQDPKVTWETGVSTFGQVLAYGAVGAVAGAAGGALVGMAAQKALS